eukprot:6190588-Pleurochrysis_carterae.AAC.4
MQDCGLHAITQGSEAERERERALSTEKRTLGSSFANVSTSVCVRECSDRQMRRAYAITIDKGSEQYAGSRSRAG